MLHLFEACCKITKTTYLIAPLRRGKYKNVIICLIFWHCVVSLTVVEQLPEEEFKDSDNGVKDQAHCLQFGAFEFNFRTCGLVVFVICGCVIFGNTPKKSHKCQI